MLRSTILLVFLSSICSFAQLTGEELLEKTVEFHDPNGNWKTFSGNLFVTMETPKSPNRDSEIKIDLPNEYFYLKSTRGKNTTEYTVHKKECSILFNDKKPSESEMKENNLNCDRAHLYKNYYTYLYGLPMKLKDPGTKIYPKVVKKTFKGKEYLVLKATYDEPLGSDIWYFYFDPKTYSMEVYQFFKKGKPNSGEYISLTGTETINGIKMPKIRAWYYNKDDKYLGTDILKLESRN